MRKKSVAVLLSVAVILSLTACGDKNEPSVMAMNNNAPAETENIQSPSGELLTMFQTNEAIEIEVAEPISIEQGEEAGSLDWTELAFLKTNETLRKNWDNVLGISAIENGKNGMLYVNADGEQTNNNTLYTALHNRQFQKALEEKQTDLAKAASENYADLELLSDEDKATAVLMGINGYFNLMPDNTPNYSNPNDTLERNEFMSMLYRANNEVQSITTDAAFENAVGVSKYNLYAQGVTQTSYLDIASGSLDNMTYNGTITRAEAVYAIVQQYFADEYKNADINAQAYSDCKNGGDIAQEAIKGNKEISSLSDVGRWKSYELTYALQNPDTVGMPESLYRAMVVAKQKGLISGSESRWDEGITKSEAVALIIEAIKRDDSMEEFDHIRAAINITDTTIDETNENENGNDNNNAPSNNSDNSQATVDATGVDTTFEEDEYRGDDVTTSQEQSAESQEQSTASQGQSTEELQDEVRDDAKEWLEEGIISEEEYKEIINMLDEMQGNNNNTSSQNTQPSQSQSQSSSSSEVIYSDPTYDPNNPDDWRVPGHEGMWSDIVVY